MVPPTPSFGVVRRTLALTACLLAGQAALLAGAEAKDKTDKPLPEPKAPVRTQPTATPTPARQPSAPAPAKQRSGKKPGKGKDKTSEPLPESPTTTGGGDGSADGPSRNNAGGAQPGSSAPLPEQRSPAPQPSQPAPAPTSAPTPPQAGEQQSPAAERRRTARDRRRAASRRRAAARRRIGGPRLSPAVPSLGAPVGPVQVGTPQGSSPRRSPERPQPGNRPRRPEGPAAAVERTVRDIVRVVPDSVKAALIAMVALVIMLAAGYLTLNLRARRLEHQRQELLKEVGLLQAALLPPVPERVGTLFASAAYRPAAGPAAGGDFYDAFQLEGGRVGILVGDVAGHGRDALAQTTLIRYTLRVYLETGLEPRKALHLAAGALREDLGAGFATALVGVYDPGDGTLSYASAGHPPPLLLGPPSHEAVTAVSAPPIGIGSPTGLRQTTVAFGPDARACFFTDGLTEARIDGDLLGRERLEGMLRDLGERPSARRLLERVVHDADHATDDMAACVIRPTVESFAGDLRVEELELDLGDDIERDARRFLEACGAEPHSVGATIEEALVVAGRSGAAVLRVRLHDGHTDVSVAPPHGAAAKSR